MSRILLVIILQNILQLRRIKYTRWRFYFEEPRRRSQSGVRATASSNHNALGEQGSANGTQSRKRFKYWDREPSNVLQHTDVFFLKIILMCMSFPFYVGSSVMFLSGGNHWAGEYTVKTVLTISPRCCLSAHSTVYNTGSPSEAPRVPARQRTVFILTVVLLMISKRILIV